MNRRDFIDGKPSDNKPERTKQDEMVSGRAWIGKHRGGELGWGLPNEIDPSGKVAKRLSTKKNGWFKSEHVYLCRVTIEPIIDKHGNYIKRGNGLKSIVCYECNTKMFETSISKCVECEEQICDLCRQDHEDTAHENDEDEDYCEDCGEYTNECRCDDCDGCGELNENCSCDDPEEKE